MPTSSTQTESVKAALAAKISRTVDSLRGAPAPGGLQIHRCEVEIPPLDALSWLEAQNSPCKVFWSNRDRSLEMAGIGQSESLIGNNALPVSAGLFTDLSERLGDAHPSVRYYGGARFDFGKSIDDNWQRLGAYRFILPRFEIISRNGEWFLACNLLVRRNLCTSLSRILADLDQLTFPGKRPMASIPPLMDRVDIPNWDSWRDKVQAAIEALGCGPLQKVVLARRTSLHFAAELDAVALLRGLRPMTPECFHFCFLFQPGTAFIGAPPERLYRREGEKIWSEAVAGTRPRGATAQADQELGLDLMHSDKDVREHCFVVRGIREALAPFCQSLEWDRRTTLLKLPQCQHLFSTFEGTLQRGVNDADLIAKLHPTPAVGGYPAGAALEKIQHMEMFDRGWYAGPVGWVGTDAAEFAVAIRSGLVAGRGLFLYSGAGIVPGSTPEAEWNELESKVRNFLQAVTRL